MIGRRRLPPLLRAALRGRRPALLPHGDTFVRGLALGALVGAAIAGSTIWNRLRGRERPARHGRGLIEPTGRSATIPGDAEPIPRT